MTRPLGIILAGGQATRMGGGDKGLLDMGGQTLLARVIARLGPQAAGIALNANGDAARFEAFGLPVLPDSVAGFPGPLAGVLAGLDWAAQQGADAIVTVAADTPFFPLDLVDRLQATADGMDNPLVLATTPDGRQPTLAFGQWLCGTTCAPLWQTGCARSLCGPMAMVGDRPCSMMRGSHFSM